MIAAFRLCKTKHLATAFSGEGARICGGRWNSPGVPMVYTSSSLSLATLEVLVHLEDPDIFARYFSWASVGIPEDAVERLDPATLPPDWDAPDTSVWTRRTGDEWILSRRSLALAVPSVITPGEWNYLLNPLHPRMPELTIGTGRGFRPDPRLLT